MWHNLKKKTLENFLSFLDSSEGGALFKVIKKTCNGNFVR